VIAAGTAASRFQRHQLRHPIQQTFHIVFHIQIQRHENTLAVVAGDD
jgi:hypothetical protein